MSGFVVLRGESKEDGDHPFPGAEIFRDPEALIERIRTDPGKISWVAITPNFSDASGVAQQIRTADPAVKVVLLGAESPETAPALAALSREQAYVRSLLHTVDMVILVVAADGTIEEWNRSAESLYGVSREAALGRSYFQFLPEEERERVREDIRRLAAGGEPTRNFENAVRTPDGIRYVLWNATLVENARGEPTILATGIDLTERRAAERMLQETHRRALEAEKLASITALTASIAHDVGTPMTAILGYAELIAKSVEDAKNRKRATTIVEQVHRVSDLIETLINLSRTEERPPHLLDLTDILDRALDFYREKLKHRGVEVARRYDPAPQILGDPNQLHQVLLSLFLIALEAMPQGGTLHVSLSETDTAGAEVRVSDTGTSIDPDLQALITEPAFSSTQRTSRAGLGLLVARTIVEQHGGRIDLTRESDRGTEIRLTFPRPREKSP